ncbi:hypothetical protein DBR43_32670 [Pedobacter sp. KBW06]|uniref:hypothetical protein n=1 Tax=Pedobacter sp. KBW06 TaxID=2153359 RepID=UPI000F5B1912|nr:hypothetical protein [Pedobacter sp. KBW06]RQO64541.1 hypothetical protein DBR43_32670 [Pedobacter sp. KBW06]
MEKTQVNVLYEQAIEIRVEFPVSVLCAYNGPSDLDVTWDDNLMYLINDALDQAGAYIKNSKLEFYPVPEKNDEVLSYQLTLIVKPPGLDLYGIAANLITENFEKGLCIKLKSAHQGFEVVYAGPFALISQ